MKCIGGIACVFSRLLRRTGGNLRFLLCWMYLHRPELKTLKDTNQHMRNIPVLNNRLDGFNGIVEHALEMKAKKTPWHLRFAQKAKGIVSFVQNLLSPLTQKEGVRGGQLSAFFQSAASAVIVGIGLLVGSIGDVQAACNPPIYDVCFHKVDGSGFSVDGTVKLEIEFDVPASKRNQQYEVVWSGLKIFFDPLTYRTWYSDAQVSDKGIYGNRTISYSDFWWDASAPYGDNNYGCSIFEGEYVNGKWVRGTQVASVDFYSYQHAALVYLNTSTLPFSLSQYYCSIDWDPVPNPLFSGYTRWRCVNYRGYWYSWGDVGSPRFRYGDPPGSRCSYTISPPSCP